MFTSTNQTNSKLELVILRFNIFKCISVRTGAGTRYLRCLFFIQQHSEAAGNKRISSTLLQSCRGTPWQAEEKDSGSSKEADAVFLLQGQCKGEKQTFGPGHLTINNFIIGPKRDEAKKKFVINCSYSLCKLEEKMETKPRQSLVYLVSTGLEELFLPVH